MGRASEQQQNTLNIQGDYEEQIRRKDKEYLVLTTNINRLELQVNEYRTTIQELTLTVRNLEGVLGQTREEKDREIR